MLGNSAEHLVRLLEILADHDARQFGYFVDLALSMLLQMNDLRFNSRAQDAIARLPSNAVFDAKREQWRRMISL